MNTYIANQLCLFFLAVEWNFYQFLFPQIPIHKMPTTLNPLGGWKKLVIDSVFLLGTNALHIGNIFLPTSISANVISTIHAFIIYFL